MLKLGTIGEFNADNPPEGVWGTFAEGVRIKVRKFTAEGIKAIRKKYVKTTMEVDRNTRAMVAVEKVDNEKYDDALNDYIIEDFQGIGDDDGNALPVNLASKKRIMNYLPLSEWIWSFAQAIDTTEAEVKNS